MILANVKQGSDEWLNFRRSRITGTDFAVYVANKKLVPNIYHISTKRLLRDKLSGKKIPDNRYFAVGRELEPVILSELGYIDVISSEIILESSNPRIMASLDARDLFLEQVIEIKTSTKDITKLKEAISYYSYQVAHACHILGYKHGILGIGCYHFTSTSSMEYQIDDILTHEIVANEIIAYDNWLSLCTEFLKELDKENDKLI